MSVSKDTASDHQEHIEPVKNDTNRVAGQIPESLLNLTEEERSHMEKKLVRKVDLRLLIMIVLMYILNYLDRNNIASAKLAGLAEDLNLHGNQYEVRSLTKRFWVQRLMDHRQLSAFYLSVTF